MRRALEFLLGAVIALLVIVKVQYGRGATYPDLSTAPALPETALQKLVTLNFPPGNVAVSPEGRIFFAYHPFAKAERFSPATVFELIDGKPQPFPDKASQPL